jgi:hypothetical protein
MPQLPFDFTFNIDESSANRVEKKIADIDNAVSKIGSSAPKGKVVGVDEATIKSFQRLGGTTKRFVKDYQQGMNQASRAMLGLGSEVKKTSDEIVLDFTQGVNLANVEAQDLEQVMNALNTSFKENRVGVGHASSGLKNLGIDARNLNKSTANANQTLFAFSDLVQDSTQFTQGFSQGMRAIGNNVAFTAELFSNLKNRVDVYNESIIAAGGSQKDMITVTSQLRKSLRGFGGVLIAINAAFVAGQIFADRHRREMKKLEEQARATAEGISEVANEFAKAMGGNVPDPFGMRARQIEIDLLEGQLKTFNEEQMKASLTSKAFSKASETAAKGSKTLRGVIEDSDTYLEKFGNGLRYAFGLDNTGVGREIITYTQYLNQAVKDFNTTVDEFVQEGKLPQEMQFLEESILANNVAMPVFVGEMIKFKDTSFTVEEDIRRLGNLFKGDTRKSFESFANSFGEFVENPLKKITEMFPNASFEMAKFFGLLKEQDIVKFEALRELRIELEKTNAEQTAFNNLLQQEGFEGFKAYKEGLDALAKATSVYNAELYLVNEGQIAFSGLLVKGKETRTEAIGRLKELADEQLRLYENTRLDTEERDRAFQVFQLLNPILQQHQEALRQVGDQVEDITFKNTAFLSGFDKIDFAVARQRAELQRLKQEFPELGAQIDVAIEKLEEFAELQKMSLAFSNISDLASGLGQLGEAFGATKDFRIAMAMVDGGAAIISTLADPTLGVAAKIGAAAGIAAQVKSTIDQMKKVKVGSGGSTGNIGASAQDVRTPSSFLSFGNREQEKGTGTGMDMADIISSARSQPQVPQVNLNIDRGGITQSVKMGQREISSRQLSP